MLEAINKNFSLSWELPEIPEVRPDVRCLRALAASEKLKQGFFAGINELLQPQHVRWKPGESYYEYVHPLTEEVKAALRTLVSESAHCFPSTARSRAVRISLGFALGSLALSHFRKNSWTWKRYTMASLASATIHLLADPDLIKSPGSFLYCLAWQQGTVAACSAAKIALKWFVTPHRHTNAFDAFKALQANDFATALRKVQAGIAAPQEYTWFTRVPRANGHTEYPAFPILHYAVLKGAHEVVREILRQHPNTLCLSTEFVKEGVGKIVEPLRLAIGMGDEEMALLLLEHQSGWEQPVTLDTHLLRARVEAPPPHKEKCTYLHLAARMGLGRVVDKLLELAPDHVDRLSQRDSSPLTFALAAENYEIAGKLRRARTNREDTIDARTIPESVWARFKDNPEVRMLVAFSQDRIPVDLYLPMVEAHLEENIVRSRESAAQAALGAIRAGGYSPEA